MEIAKENQWKIPSKPQLRDGGVLPRWQRRTEGSRLHPIRAITVFRGRGRGDQAGGGRSAANMAVLDANDVSMEGASYESSASSGIPTDTRSEERHARAMDLFGSNDSDSSSDDCMLPMYTCAGGCDSAMVTGGGGTLLCTTCRSRQVFNIGDSVALLGLRTRGCNHRQGVAIGTCDDQRAGLDSFIFR